MTGMEVEVKAVVEDTTSLRSHLDRLGTHIRSFDKEDRYYGVPAEAPLTRFRLRRDDGTWVCTCKNKKIHEGIEQSVETEFSVSDDQAFDTFAREIGFTRLFVKRKLGDRWEVDGVTVEVSDVNDLGTFIEAELILHEDVSDSEIETARRRVRNLLRRLGLPDSAIEPRTYTGMIHEKFSSLEESPGDSV